MALYNLVLPDGGVAFTSDSAEYLRGIRDGVRMALDNGSDFNKLLEQAKVQENRK
jgi:hypothetical protein